MSLLHRWSPCKHDSHRNHSVKVMNYSHGCRCNINCESEDPSVVLHQRNSEAMESFQLCNRSKSIRILIMKKSSTKLIKKSSYNQIEGNESKNTCRSHYNFFYLFFLNCFHSNPKENCGNFCSIRFISVEDRRTLELIFENIWKFNFVVSC